MTTHETSDVTQSRERFRRNFKILLLYSYLGSVNRDEYMIKVTLIHKKVIKVYKCCAHFSDRHKNIIKGQYLHRATPCGRYSYPSDKNIIKVFMFFSTASFIAIVISDIS